ncbi:MAG: RNA polymerase sigma-70 factor [Anaerolineae bacterium]|nr:MAG: RNA polymerase sigma-70 factor [Anaerolineae bacterium]
METFETYRSLLFSIAYRMTGSVMEAEDLVQETYLRIQAADATQITSYRAFLTTIITRLAINVLNSSRERREHYIGPWLPEPMLTANNPHLVHPVERDDAFDSISTAFLLLLETLTPLERAVFLLKEVFDYRYEEIAQILDRTEAACRKLGTRAKQHILDKRPRFVVSTEQYQRVIDSFLNACQTGDLEGLISLLTQDAIIYSDGGGKAVAGTRPVGGQEIVARFILGGLRVIADHAYTWDIMELNGRPAIVVRVEGKAFGVVQFELSGHQLIDEIHFITNPDKIGHL